MKIGNNIASLKTIKASEEALRALSEETDKHIKNKLLSGDFLNVMNFYNVAENNATRKSSLGLFIASDKAPSQPTGAYKWNIQMQA